MNRCAGLILSVVLSIAAARGHAQAWQDAVAAAASSAQQAQSSGARLRALTTLIAAQESGLAELRADLRWLSAAETALRDQMLAQDRQLSDLLAALQRQDPQAAPLSLVHPQGAEAAARAAGLSEAIIAALAAQRWGVDLRLRELSEAHNAVAQAQTALNQLQSETEAARQALIAAAAARGPLPPAFDSEAAAARVRSLEAQDLSGLRQVYGSGAVETGAAPKGLDLPLVSLQDPKIQGDGWLLRGVPGAQVLAPASATVLYSGPLRGHRIVVLLEVSPGRLISLSGLGQALVRTREAVTRGQPLGLLPQKSRGDSQRIVTDRAIEAGGIARDALYMELRDADRPVDPALWFTVTEDE